MLLIIKICIYIVCIYISQLTYRHTYICYFVYKYILLFLLYKSREGCDVATLAVFYLISSRLYAVVVILVVGVVVCTGSSCSRIISALGDIMVCGRYGGDTKSGGEI